MKKLFLTTLIFTLPFLASAQGPSLVSNYSKMMQERLAFGLNRNAKLYNGLVEKSVQLAEKGKDLSVINPKLAETKIIIDRGQKHLAELPERAKSLTASSTPKESYAIVRGLIREIVQDLRLSYAKIREIKLLIKRLK
ncbi:MAG: hypothetical protein WC385_03180 [Candidatus Paceibacterota bacterium]|jgi:uncharacterized coiled-coil protein SlyX